MMREEMGVGMIKIHYICVWNCQKNWVLIFKAIILIFKKENLWNIYYATGEVDLGNLHNSIIWFSVK